jgi:hypothetical protein
MPRSIDRADRRRERLAALLLAGLFVVLVGFAPRAAAAASVFTPVADSYVDASQPDARFGSQTQLRGDGSPVVRGSPRRRRRAQRTRSAASGTSWSAPAATTTPR